MSKITNKTGLPEPLVNAVKFSDYNRGDGCVALMHGKRCGHCLRILKPDMFYRRKGKLHSWCKKCVLEKIKLCDSARKSKNPSSFKAQAAARMRRWRDENRDKNRRQDNSRKRLLYKTSPEYRKSVRAQNQARWKNNKAELALRNKLWRSTERGKRAVRACVSKRKSRLRGATTIDGSLAVKKLASLRRVLCFYCGVSIKGEWHIEHLFPISKGGEHSAANIVASCPSCNLSKGSLSPNEFLKKGQLLLL